MYPVSDRWDAAIRTSGTVVSRVEVWRAGVFTGVTLNVTGGTVRADATSKVRRALALTSSDVDLMPASATDILNPVDTDLKVFTGVAYTEGDTELVPVFTGRIMEPARSGWLDELTISADDYSSVIADARFPVPWNVPAGSRAFSTIAAMVRDVLPWVSVINLTGSNPTVRPVSFARERDDAITALADMCGGAEWYFNPNGDFVVAKPPTVSTVPDWEVDVGTPTAVMTGSGESLSSRGVFNAVTCTSAPSEGTPQTVTRFQGTGPLRYRAGFKKPVFWETNLAMTRAMLTDAALRRLTRSLMLASKVPATCAPNPALGLGDTVGVVKPSGVRTLQVVSGFTVPLTAGDVGSDGMSLSLSSSVDLAGIDDQEGVS